MKNFLRKLGLFFTPNQDPPYSYRPNDYVFNQNKEKLLAHRDFLKSKETEENSRLTLIESKTSQLVSQTGIIFSLLSLFVPLLLDKLLDVSLLVKFIFFLLLLLAFLFYILTIRNALKNFNVKNYIYSTPSPNNVIKHQHNSIEDFYTEEIQDLLYCINQNVLTNNIKASNLLHSYTSFKVANTLTGVLVSLFCLYFFFFSPKKEKASNPTRIENFDSLMNNLINEIKDKRDTIWLQIPPQPKKRR